MSLTFYKTKLFPSLLFYYDPQLGSIYVQTSCKTNMTMVICNIAISSVLRLI